MKIIAKTFKGLEPALMQEIKDLGGTEIKELNRAVRFEGDKELLYRGNLWLRTAIKLIVPIYEFEAKTQEEFYEILLDYEWEKHLHVAGTFAISSSGKSEVFKHSKFLAYKTKDALVDRYRYKYGRRPDVDTDQPNRWFNIHVRDTRFTLSIDSSGESLHYRGYRHESGEAPLNEVMAAGLIKLSGWQGDTDFIDPMCGSGTILIEACRMAMNIPPQHKNTAFAFKTWPDFDGRLWKKITNEIEERRTELKVKIVGIEIDKETHRIAESTLRRADHAHDITVRCQDFFENEEIYEAYTLVTNPPYDERLSIDDAIAFYKLIGDQLKQKFVNSSAWIFSGNITALKNLGLKASRRIHLMNGPIEAKLHKFEIYDGSKKNKD